MKEIIVKDIYTVDTISKSNINAWKILSDVVKNEVEDVLFDFKGIDVLEPYNNEYFIKFIKDEKVYMRLYSSYIVTENINALCKLNGVKSDRVYNIETEAIVEKSAEDKKTDILAKETMPYIVNDNGDVVLKIYNKVEQLHSVDTVISMEKAIKKYCENNNVNKVTIETAGLSIQKNIIGAIAEMIIRMKESGIKVIIKSDEKEVMDKFNIYSGLSVYKNVSGQNKLAIVKDSLKTGMVGMLIKYKKSKGVDEFGRHGNGEIQTGRVAIFKGYIKKDGVECLKFREYNGNTFYPKLHWQLEHDNESLNALEYTDLVLNISEIGVNNLFFGSHYHFSLPIQYSKNDSKEIYGTDDKGSYTILASIPIRIKLVLDDWGIEYDKENLDYAIKETEKIIGRSEVIRSNKMGN